MQEWTEKMGVRSEAEAEATRTPQAEATASEPAATATEPAATTCSEAVAAEQRGVEMANVTVIVEWACEERGLSTCHDASRYATYYELVVRGLAGSVLSPCHAFAVRVDVEHGAADGYARLGAFEVVLLTHLTSVGVPSRTLLHSKLATRRWPCVSAIADR
jgi:hypothetical protein